MRFLILICLFFLFCRCSVFYKEYKLKHSCIDTNSSPLVPLVFTNHLYSFRLFINNNSSIDKIILVNSDTIYDSILKTKSVFLDGSLIKMGKKYNSWEIFKDKYIYSYDLLFFDNEKTSLILDSLRRFNFFYFPFKSIDGNITNYVDYNYILEVKYKNNYRTFYFSWSDINSNLNDSLNYYDLHRMLLNIFPETKIAPPETTVTELSK